MKFITIKYKGETYKVNLEQVRYIEIYDNRVEFNFEDRFVAAIKDETLNFKEIKEIAENL